MKNSLRYRIQERLADRFDWVQYPGREYIPKDADAATQPVIRWKHQMPMGKRIYIGISSLALIAVALPLVFGLGYIIYCVLYAVFTA